MFMKSQSCSGRLSSDLPLPSIPLSLLRSHQKDSRSVLGSLLLSIMWCIPTLNIQINNLTMKTLSFENNFIMSYWEWLVCKIGSLSYCSLLCWPDQPSSCRLNRFIFSKNGPSFDIYATIWDPLVIHLFINLLIGSLMNTNATVTCFT